MHDRHSIPELERVSDYVDYFAEHAPDRVALVHGQERLTHSEVKARVDAIADALLHAGIAKGDRIAMLSTPRTEFFLVFLATISIGAVWVGLNPRYKIGEFRHVIREAQPKLIIALAEIDGRRYDEELATLDAEFDCVEAMVTFGKGAGYGRPFEAFVADGRAASPDARAAARTDVGADDTAVIIFTSGSTGAPKGAMLAHYGLIHGARTEHRHWFHCHPVVLANMPINHIAGLGMITTYGYINGGTVVFQERFEPEAVLRLIEAERITFWLQAPTMFHFTVNHPRFADTDISSLTHIIWAGSPMAEELVARLNALGARLATAFGMTELSTYVTFSDADADFEVLANTIGRPEAGYDLRLGNEHGNPVPRGQEGEIQARGRWLMKGYFNQAQATREAFTPDGWFRTGGHCH